ncbi:helix-turn-helix domain-containing protein [Streptomyces sp. NPDC059708]|uniref:helix-turn-helix domain-containing protein n=1 Tax=Streptomyces sp. NPDC059708 TaxID=3346916 RepID=UPI0036AD5BAB
MEDDGPSVEVGDHLSRHPELSLLAIGLAVHIASLPDGSPVGIRTLTARFPEGEVRIAGGLRELEAAGYLERRRVRTGGGRVVTRTVFYSRPAAVPPPDDPPPPPPAPPADRAPLPELAPEPVPSPVVEAPAAEAPGPASDREPVAVGGVVRLPEAPGPSGPVRREALELLARLRGDDPRLLLGERDVRRLAPGVSAWLERGAEPDAVRRVLAAGLPADMRSPAALLGYRLRAGLPPELPREAPPPRRQRPDPFQTCDGCERAFRAPAPGRCGECPPEGIVAAA